MKEKKREKKYMIYHTVLRETQNYYLDPTGAYMKGKKKTEKKIYDISYCALRDPKLLPRPHRCIYLLRGKIRVHMYIRTCTHKHTHTHTPHTHTHIFVPNMKKKKKN